MPKRDLLLSLPPNLVANVLSRLDCLSVAAVLEAYEELRPLATLVTDHSETPFLFTSPGLKRHVLAENEISKGFRLLRALDAPLQLFEFAAHGYQRMVKETRTPHRKFAPLRHFGNKTYMYFRPPSDSSFNHGDRIIAGNRTAVFLRRQGAKVFFDENPHSRLSLCSNTESVKGIIDVLEWQVFQASEQSLEASASPLSLSMESPQSTTYTVPSPLTDDGCTAWSGLDNFNMTDINYTSFVDDTVCDFLPDSRSILSFSYLQQLRLDKIANLQGLHHQHLQELVIFTKTTKKSIPVFANIECMSLKKLVVTYEKAFPTFHEVTLPELETFELLDRRSLGDTPFPFTYDPQSLARLADGFSMDFIKTCTSITFGGTPDEILSWLRVATELRHFAWRRVCISINSSLYPAGTIRFGSNLETLSIYNSIPYSTLPFVRTNSEDLSNRAYPLNTLSIINCAPGLEIKHMLNSSALEKLSKFYFYVEIDPRFFPGDLVFDVPEIRLNDIYRAFGYSIEEIYIYGCCNTISLSKNNINGICPKLKHMEIELQLIPERLYESINSSQSPEDLLKSLRHETFTEYIPPNIKELWISQRPYVEKGLKWFYTGSISLETVTELHAPLSITSGPCSFGSILIPHSNQMLVSKWTGEQSTKGFNAWRRPDKGERFLRL